MLKIISGDQPALDSGIKQPAIEKPIEKIVSNDENLFSFIYRSIYNFNDSM